jgi:hypothetical protein
MVVSTTDVPPALRDSILVKLDLFPAEDAEGALSAWLQEARRTLQDDQRAKLLAYFSRCGLPLYLKLAFEEARRWRSFDQMSSCVLGDRLAGIVDVLFDRLELDANHGKIFVSRGLGYLAAARSGLTEDEMLDVLSADPRVWVDFKARARHDPPEHRLPVVVWSRFYLDLEPYLTERAAPGGTVVAFYQRQIGDTAKTRCLSSGEKPRAHSALAVCFRRRADPAGDATWTGNDVRGLTELPFHLFSAGATAELASVLGEIAFAAAKSAVGAVYDLLRDYDTSVPCFSVGRVEHLPLAQLSSILYRYDMPMA